jgi:hypothetical protein
MHDTFARRASAAFPDIPYLAPAGFAKLSGVPTLPLHPPPRDWAGEIEVLEVDELRKNDEHVFFHLASRTLVLADLLFHFPADSRGWSRFFAQRIMRLPRLVGVSAFFRLMIRDQKAFALSMERCRSGISNRSSSGTANRFKTMRNRSSRGSCAIAVS